MFRLLLLGPIESKSGKPNVGGAVALFKLLLEEAQNIGIDFQIIDTNKRNYNNPVSSYFSIFFQLISKGRNSDHISIHSSRDYLFISLFLIPIAKIFRKKISLRKFGGDPVSTVRGSFLTQEKIARLIISKFDLLFVETKYLVEYFKGLNKSVNWFPNVRKKPKIEYSARKFSKKFIFIGHVKKEKGISDLIEAARKIPDDCVIDIYGPIEKNEYTIEELNCTNVNYCGSLKSEDVIDTMNKYDVLILPSYKEGYPGVIIEAFSLGLPVIVSDLTNLKEIVTDNVHGKIFSVGKPDELAKAITYYNEENYLQMSINSHKHFSNFESSKVNAEFIQKVSNVK